MSLSGSLASIVRSIVATLVLLAIVIILASVIRPSGLALLGVVLWILVLGGLGVGLYLALRAGRPLAGLGAILTAIAVALAFFWYPQPNPSAPDLSATVWTVLFLAGVILIVLGTAQDTIQRGAWPLVLARVAIGWALVDNAQDHFRSNWLPGGGGFRAIATGAGNRPPLYFLDPVYQDFLKGVVVPNADLWAALTAGGELTFGLLVAIGLFAPIGAAGLMFLNANYALMKGFVAHGAYTDKVFFTLELLVLVTAAGLVYGLDASLRRLVPAWAARTLMAAPAEEPEAVPRGRPQPRST